MHILAIDQGTSSTKALVVAADGVVRAEAEIPVRSHTTDDGGVEQDPEEIWQSVLDAGRRALAQAGEAVGALGLANQGETVLAWERGSGRPLSCAISWQDRRALRVCAALREHGERLRERTGLPLDPYFAAPKMRWLREQVTRAGVCTTTDTWLVHRLCGAYATDASTASRTLLLDLDTAAWSPEACALFAIPPETLPAIVPCAGVIGITTAFGGSLPVAGLAVDQQAALFAQSCVAAGEAKCTYGTGAFLLATVGAQARRSASGLVTCIAWQLADRTTYCLDGQVYTVGAAVNWLRDMRLIDGPGDLDAIGGAAADAGSARFVPALAGLAAPFWRPAARAAFTGLSLSTTRSQLVRAAVDGIAAQVAVLAAAVGTDLGRPLTHLRVDGGLTRSRLLMQTQADLLQAPVEVYPSPHATAFGVAALARLGSGAAADAAAAVGTWQPADVYAPRIGADEAAARVQRWRRAAEATMELA